MKDILIILRSVLFIIAAIVAFVFASEISEFYVGEWINEKFYGGDAYTGIQNAAALTGCNVVNLAIMIRHISFCAFTLSGIILLGLAIPRNFYCKKHDGKSIEQPIQNQNEPTWKKEKEVTQEI